MPTETITIVRVGKPNPNWRADYIPEGDVEHCICNPYGPCSYHKKLLEKSKKDA